MKTNKSIATLILLGLIITASSCKVHNLFQDPMNDNAYLLDRDSIFYPQVTYEHSIAIDDKISISVWGQDNYSVGSVYGIYNSNEVYGKWLQVDSKGNIEVPQIGTLRVKNMTIPQLKQYLKIAFGKWLNDPIVDVRVLDKTVTILGEVRNPGVISTDKDRILLLDIVAKSGGFDHYANLKSVKLLRQDGENVKIANIDLTVKADYRHQNLQIWPGDFIIIPSKKNKEFDRRISNIIPFASTATAATLLMGAL